MRKKHKIQFILISLLSLLVFSCTKSGISEEDDLQLNFTTPPIALDSVDAKFAADVAYANYPHTTFDIFMPKSSAPTALVIWWHGGGFTGGDKTVAYDNVADDIAYFLKNNIAFVTANYRLIQDSLEMGAEISLQDSKRCVQFIRYHAKALNIDKSRIACYGNSAGGGISIWLAFHPEMAEPNSTDLISRESSRLKVVGHNTSQASYDPIYVQDFYMQQGINYFAITGVEEQILASMAIPNMSYLTNDSATIVKRKEADLIGWMSSDDPPLYTQNINELVIPTDRKMANHTPMFEKLLKLKADSLGLENKSLIPSLNINTTQNETMSEFLKRKLLE
ncbi:MAG: alpha/beta hydrolase [Chitinophagales bacterium]|nr:alpha/beta hydrolase [Bacteroidota bacterium]